MHSRFRSLPRLAAGLLLVVGIVAGCSDSSGPSSTGRTGRFAVAAVTFDETTRPGFVSCALQPFTFQVDSTASVLDITGPATVPLVCDHGAAQVDTTPLTGYFGAPTTDPIGHAGLYAYILSDPNAPGIYIELWWDSLSAPLSGDARHFESPVFEVHAPWTAKRK